MLFVISVTHIPPAVHRTPHRSSTDTAPRPALLGTVVRLRRTRVGMHSGQRPAHGHPLLYMGIRGRNEAHTLKRPWSEYLQKDGSSELTRFVTDTGIVPNRTKTLRGFPWPPAPPRHRGRPARAQHPRNSTWVDHLPFATNVPAPRLSFPLLWLPRRDFHCPSDHAGSAPVSADQATSPPRLPPLPHGKPAPPLTLEPGCNT